MKALIVTASIVLSALLLCVAWLAFFPGNAGGPVDQRGSYAAAAKTAGTAAARRSAPAPSIDLPPGFGISPARPQSARVERPARSSRLGPRLNQARKVSPNRLASRRLPCRRRSRHRQDCRRHLKSETASITLVDVPVAELVEESQYGPLPKVATDGRRPIDVYARPSKYAVKAADAPPRIAVLINGMGLSDGATAEAIKDLPAPISVAYGAYGRNLQDWVEKARQEGHEVLLQIPLEPLDYPTNDPGPHTLLTTLPPEENLKRLQWLMSRFTGYVGITNLMGAKFEPTQASFVPVLEEVKARGLLVRRRRVGEGFRRRPDRQHHRSRLCDRRCADRCGPLARRYQQGTRPPRSRCQGEGLCDRHRQRQARDHQAALAMGRTASGQEHHPYPGQRGHPLAASKLILIP